MIKEKEIAFYRSNVIDKYVIEIQTALEAEEKIAYRQYLFNETLKTNPNYKRCKDCGKYKRLTEFYKNTLKKQGVFDYCKQCAKEKAKRLKERKNALVKERETSFENAMLVN